MRKRFKILLGIFTLVSLILVLACDDKDSSTKPVQLDSPVFSISPGVYSQVIQVEISCSTAGAEIYYTTDGSIPSESSQLYSQPVTLINTKTLKAIAYKDNYDPSEVTSGKYWIALETVENPIISPDSGTYLEQQTIVMDCPTEDASIHYTLDGSEPDQQSLKYEDAFLLNDSCVLKAKAFKEYYPCSEIVEMNYIITSPSVSLPSFNPSPGLYDNAQTVSLHCSTPDATIYYTLDGSIPTENSLLYSSTISVNSTTTIRAIAYKEGYLASSVISGEFIIEYPVVATPKLSLEPGSYLGNQILTIQSSTSGARIYYTLDGSEPTEASTEYTSSIELRTSTIVKARGFKTDYLASEIAVGDYQIFQQKVDTPMFNPPPGDYVGEQMFTITCSTPGAAIYYTTNESQPDDSSYPYNNPLSVSSTVTIKARAYADDYYPSDIVEGRYLIGDPIPDNFIFVEGGTFNNGTADVVISSFYMSECEIKQVEFQSLIGTNPVVEYVQSHPGTSYYGLGPNYPVYHVDWYQAAAYCNARSLEEGLTACYNFTEGTCDFSASGYRLPTEMEWMYAAKGGNQQPSTGYNTYAGTDDEFYLANYAWYLSSTWEISCSEVALLLPNELGFYDMSGNLMEWCNDWFSALSSDPQTDPTGPETGSHKVYKGGAWEYSASTCEVAFRAGSMPSNDEDYTVGFRIVRRLN